MVFGKTYGELEEWHFCFIWFPRHLSDGRWAWLETIERRGTFIKYYGYVWEYRLIK